MEDIITLIFKIESQINGMSSMIHGFLNSKNQIFLMNALEEKRNGDQWQTWADLM